jgi:hypothetical protein
VGSLNVRFFGAIRELTWVVEPRLYWSCPRCGTPWTMPKHIGCGQLAMCEFCGVYLHGLTIPFPSTFVRREVSWLTRR